MVQKNHLTKFCFHLPRTSKRVTEVAFLIADSFLLIDAPAIHWLDYGFQFLVSRSDYERFTFCGLDYLSFTAGRDTHDEKALLNEQMVT